jgi:hypothetical protein
LRHILAGLARNAHDIPLGQSSFVDQQSNDSIKSGPRCGGKSTANTHPSDPDPGQIGHAHVRANKQNVNGFRRNSRNQGADRRKIRDSRRINTIGARIRVSHKPVNGRA